jgi:hypothetical protein
MLTRAVKRIVWLVVETMAATLGLAFVLGLLLVWRANQGPIVIDSIAPQLAQLLSNPATGTRTEIGHAQILWNRDEQALRLVANSVQVFDAKDRLVAALPQLALGLNFLAPLHGQLAPLEISSHDFSLRLTRAAEGGLLFGDVPLERSAEMPTTNPITQADVVAYVRQFLQLDTSWFGLGRVGAVRLTNIHLVVGDAAQKKDWASFTVPQLTLVRHRSNVQVRAKLMAQLGNGQSSAASDLRFEGDYYKQKRTMELKLKFSDINPIAWAKAFNLSEEYAAADSALNGSVKLSLDEQIVPQELTVDVTGRQGKIVLPALWAQPLAINGLGVQASLHLQTHQVELQQAWLDIGGVKISADMKAIPMDPQQPDTLSVTAHAAIKDWPLARVAEIWPALVAPNPRDWIMNNMSVGRFPEVAADASWTAQWHEPDAMQNLALKAKLSLENATIKYLDGMPPVTGVNATGDADRSSLTIHIAGGKADKVVLGAAPIVITGLDAADQNISIELVGKNSVSDVIRLIDQPPLHYARAVGLQPDQVAGMAVLDVKLGFPLLKALPLAKISDLASDKLVKGLSIKQGALDLAVDGEKLSVTGKASYNGVLLDTVYRQVFSAPIKPAAPVLQSSATLRGVLEADDLSRLGLPMAEAVSGTIPATLTYEKTFTAPATLQLNADFSPATIKLPMLGWDKIDKQTASAKIKLELDKKAVTLKQFELKGQQLDIAVRGTLDSATMTPITLTCQPCKIGRTDMRAKLDFVAGQLDEVALTGAVLDYHDPADTEKSVAPTQPSTPAKPIKIRLDLEKLYQSNEHFFANVRGTLKRDAIGWDMMDLRAMADGKSPLTLMLQPQANGSRKLTMTADDLGDVLRAADVTDQFHDGRLLITGNSTVESPYKISGDVLLKKYRVRKLPVLAVLLNAVSFTGFLDMMGGQGLNFDRLEGRFVWEGQRYTLDDVRTAGGALGLNVEGTLDFAANQVDLRGTVVPFSFFNSIISNIPIVGDIITGGKGGGLVAATYQAKGPVQKPEISVNPVSFLAPGILRRIFFQN